MKQNVRRNLTLIAVTMLIFTASSLLAPKVSRNEKSIDQYWAESELDATEIEMLLSPASCYSERNAFLSCVNSIQRMAERFNLKLNSKFELNDIEHDRLDVVLTEKEELTAFADLYSEGMPESAVFLDLFRKLNKEQVGDHDRAAVIAAGLNGFFSVYKDPHTYLLPISYYEEVIAQNESRQVQYGFVSRRIENKIIVRKVYEGSPAEKSGLRRGDVILRLNNKDVSKMGTSRFYEAIRNFGTQRIGLLVERGGPKGQEHLYVDLIKAEFFTPSVTARVIGRESKLGLLTLHRFAKGTCRSAQKELEGLKQKGISGLLLDLRDNPGGQVQEAACIINMFVKRGVAIFETRYLSHLPPDRYMTEQEQMFSGPVAVLINGGSASASEIVAGALKDLGRAILVGERSFGKGSFQDGRVWGAHKKIAVFETQGMYFFPSGWTPQLVGIEPDIRVAMGATQEGREDLFFNPLVPASHVERPRGLGLLKMDLCDSQPELLAKWVGVGDEQIERASMFLSCDGSSARVNNNGAALQPLPGG